MLRVATAGSVDDGKSTLIGRLLYDAKALMTDQEADLKDLANLTDGLRAEREQGITIDVAYRYFTTPRRSFIIADTPGHERYTRNMVTGASTAQLAVILIDARHGIVEQSRRHAALSALLGIRHMVAAVNKMDLVDWDEGRFREIEGEFGGLTSMLDLCSKRRQRRRARRGRLVRRTAAARAPRVRRRRDRPRRRPAAAAGAVGDPPRGWGRRRAPLRRADGGRHAAPR